MGALRLAVVLKAPRRDAHRMLSEQAAEVVTDPNGLKSSKLAEGVVTVQTFFLPQVGTPEDGMPWVRQSMLVGSVDDEGNLRRDADGKPTCVEGQVKDAVAKALQDLGLPTPVPTPVLMPPTPTPEHPCTRHSPLGTLYSANGPSVIVKTPRLAVSELGSCAFAGCLVALGGSVLPGGETGPVGA